MVTSLQGEVPGGAKQATLAMAAAAKQGTAGVEATEPTLSPGTRTARGKENFTPDRDQVGTLLGRQQLLRHPCHWHFHTERAAAVGQ